MAILKQKQRPKANKLKKGPLPFHNIVTREMADRHNVRVQTRMDRMAAERTASYQTEYNMIAARAHRGVLTRSRRLPPHGGTLRRYTARPIFQNKA